MPSRSDIRDWVRQHTLVESDDYADDKINNVINQAVRDLSTQFHWPFLQTSTVVTLVADTTAYDLPDDFAHLEKAVRSDCACPLQELTPSVGWSTFGATPDSSSKPEYFWIWGEQIIVAPGPSGDSIPTVTLFYYKQAETLENDVDEPEWHPQFHLVLAEFAAAKVWEREEDLAKSNYYMDRYISGVERMARYYPNRASDAPLVIGSGHSTARKFPRMPWLEV